VEKKQTELFGVDQYGVHTCRKCGALGTIVQMGACCRIAQLDGRQVQPQQQPVEPRA
jgi:hypothetical protein